MNRRWHVKKARAPPGQVVSARPDLRRIHVNHECQPSVNRRLFEACQPVSISNRTRYNDWLSWQLPSASDPPNCHSARGCRCPLYSRGSDWNIIRSPHNETARPPPFIPVRCCCSSPRVRGSTRTTPSNYIENLAYGLVTRTLSSLARDRAFCLPVVYGFFRQRHPWERWRTHSTVSGRYAGFRSTSLFWLRNVETGRDLLPEEILDEPSRCTFTIEPVARLHFRGEARREERNLHFCWNTRGATQLSHSRPRDSCVTVKPRGKLCLSTFPSAALEIARINRCKKVLLGSPVNAIIGLGRYSIPIEKLTADTFMIVRRMVGDLAVVKVIAIDWGGEREREKIVGPPDSVSRRVEHLAVAGKTIKDGREDGSRRGTVGSVSLDGEPIKFRG